MIRLGVGLVICLVLITALGFRGGSVSTRGSSLFDDCRRRRKPLRPGEFALDGIWLDHRNNHKVRLRQSGSNYNQTAQLWAYYVDPAECPDPNPNLTEDFFGDLLNDKLKGVIYLCGHVPEDRTIMPAGCKLKGHARREFTDAAPLLGAFDPASPNHDLISCNFRWSVCGKAFIKSKVAKMGQDTCSSFWTSAEASLPKEEVCCDCYPKCAGDLSESAQPPGPFWLPPGNPGKRDTTSRKPDPKLDLTIDADGKSMNGTYVNPYTNQTETIYLTKEKSLPPWGGDYRGSYDDDWVTYYPNTVMSAKTTTTIYADASTASGVKMTLPAGTQMVMEHVILGPDGNPAWYYVTDNSSVGGTKWQGFVPAPMVRCPGVDQNRSSS